MGTSSSTLNIERYDRETYEKERSEYWKKEVEIQQKHEEELLKQRNIWTKENIPDFLERMYIHNLSSDYIEGPCGNYPYACSQEFLDESVLPGYQEKFRKIGFNLHWKKTYRYWSTPETTGVYHRSTLQYWFYLSKIDETKPVISFNKDN